MRSKRYSVLAFVGLLISVPLSSPFAVGNPLFEKTDVFPAREGGYVIVRVPGIVVSNKGTLLAYGEARHAPGQDWSDIDLVLRRSTDGGKSWQPTQMLEDGTQYVNQPRNSAAPRKPGQEQFVTCNNAAMIVDRTDDVIHFLYCIDYGRCFYRRSTDDGVTFSQPVEITSTFEAFRPEYDWKVLATGPGHGIQLANGRLVVPVWLSTSKGGNAHHPSCVSVIYSDDHGKTWQRGDIVVNVPDLADPSETVAVQLADGRVMLNIRNENKEHRRAVSYSEDGATNWTKPVFDQQLYEPVCMGSIIRVSTSADSDRNRLLFCNPHSLEPRDDRPATNVMKKRQNLSVKLSYDDGQTWPINKSIEPGASEYSDMAIGQDGVIYCLYSRGAVTCARFNIEWLTDGKDTGPVHKE